MVLERSGHGLGFWETLTIGTFIAEKILSLQHNLEKFRGFSF